MAANMVEVHALSGCWSSNGRTVCQRCLLPSTLIRNMGKIQPSNTTLLNPCQQQNEVPDFRRGLGELDALEEAYGDADPKGLLACF